MVYKNRKLLYNRLAYYQFLINNKIKIKQRKTNYLEDKDKENELKLIYDNYTNDEIDHALKYIENLIIELDPSFKKSRKFKKFKKSVKKSKKSVKKSKKSV